MYIFKAFKALTRSNMAPPCTHNHKTSPFHHFISVNYINVRDAAKLWQQLSPEEQNKYEKCERLLTADRNHMSLLGFV